MQQLFPWGLRGGTECNHDSQRSVNEQAPEMSTAQRCFSLIAFPRVSAVVFSVASKQFRHHSSELEIKNVFTEEKHQYSA